MYLLISRFKKNNMNFSLLASLTFLLGLSACGFRHDKPTVDEGLIGKQLNSRSIGYAEIRSTILVPKCLACHSGQDKPDLTTYSAIKKNLPDIVKSTLNSHKMPKDGTLSQRLRDYLERWVNMGAPEVADVTHDPAPSPPVGAAISRPVTFSQLKDKVLTPSCNGCHSIGNTHGFTELETYKSVMSVEEWLQPMVFGIYGDTVVPPEQKMPPAKSPQMTEEQKAILLLWFADGKKQ